MPRLTVYRFLHPLFGEYHIRLRGEGILPFLYRQSAAGVLLWNIRKERDPEEPDETGEERTADVYRLRTSLACAEALLAGAKEAGIHAEILRTRGLPFFAARYRKRPGLLLGMLAGLALLFFAELFVWKITVNGNTLLSDREIIDALDAYGISVGSYIPKIPILRAQNDFLLTYGDISSIAINVKGTHIEVEVLERTHAPEIDPNDGVCDLVAAEDGIVLSVDVAAGTAMVHPGDVVTEGQILVSAYTVDGRGVYRLHHARGSVKAQVYESCSFVVPLERTVKHYTGRVKKKTTLTLLGKDLDLFRTEESPYESFDTEINEVPFVLFSVAETPIVRTTVSYTEYKPEVIAISPEQAQKEAEDAFRAWLERQSEEILETASTIAYDEIQNAYILNAEITLCREIGLDLPITPDEAPPEGLTPPGA